MKIVSQTMFEYTNLWEVTLAYLLCDSCLNTKNLRQRQKSSIAIYFILSIDDTVILIEFSSVILYILTKLIRLMKFKTM